MSKVDSTGTRTYLRDGAYVTGPVLSDGAAMYTPGISERRSSVTKFYHPDRLGTTERLTDTNQSTTDTRQYDAFGLLTSSSGNTPTPFGFAGAWGYQEDPDSGLKLLGHRYYDPSTGRFLTRDPVKDGRNWYGYCGNNPSTFRDPGGLRKCFVGPEPNRPPTITIGVHNYWLGHAIIVVDFGDARGTFVIENIKNGNTVIERNRANEDNLPAVERTLPFDPSEFPAPYDFINGLPDEYNLITNNCVHLAVSVWKRATGEDLTDIWTPGALEKSLRRMSRPRSVSDSEE
ncbi:MAG: RHS repeat-associated core domain-containing protein [Fimbriimonadaceae bacterium]|nr:MAG: RHS repeat-associated core domain-containing protein [Fimbriimonadaceae bacterium]